jgi:uncharacterized membrane protein YhfC
MNILHFTYPLSVLLIFTLALGVGALLTRRFKLSWGLFWVGAVVFVLSQVLHIPFNAVVFPYLSRSGLLPQAASPGGLLLVGLAVGLSAGIFEEGARGLMYRFWVKNARSWGQGLLLGAGHGGAEAVIVGGLILLTFINMVALQGRDLQTVVPPEQLALAQQQVETYWSLPWYDSMLGFVERLFTLPVHIALSVIVLQVFTRRQIRWLFLAIAWHTLLNALGAVYVMQTYGVYWAEVTVGVFGLLSLGVIFLLRTPEPEAPAPPEPEPVPAVVLERVVESEEQIEASRFDP